LALAGCTDGSPRPPAAAEPTVVPLADLDLGELTAVRAPYCERLDADQVIAVLGGKPRHRRAYAPGDRVGLAPGVVDVVQEYGCVYFRGPVTARTWLFSQPVTRALARSYVRSQQGAPGCAPAGVLRYGAPGVVQTCRSPARRSSGSSRVVTMSGLFGDGWLTCPVTAPTGVTAPTASEPLVERTPRWSASVPEAVGAP